MVRWIYSSKIVGGHKLLDKLATNISIIMKNYFITRNDSVEVYEYMLKVLLNTFSVIFICSLISYILGYLEFELYTLIAVGMLKFFTGGIHIKNNDICVIVSSSLLLLLPILFFNIESSISNYFYIIILLSLIIIFFIAPQGINVASKQKMFYKITSIIILLFFGFVIKNDLLVFSQSIHCLSLLILREKNYDK